MSPHVRLETSLLLSRTGRTHKQKIGKPKTRPTSPSEVTLPYTHAAAAGSVCGGRFSRQITLTTAVSINLKVFRSHEPSSLTEKSSN